MEDPLEAVKLTLRRFIVGQELATNRHPSFIDGAPAEHWDEIMKRSSLTTALSSSSATATATGTDSVTDSTTESAVPLTLSRLPNELLLQCISYLDVREIISLRRMSRHFATLCTPELFNTGFSMRPQRDDMLRLAHCSLIPEIADSIQHLTIYMGDMSMDQFVDSISTAYVSASNNPTLPIHKIFDPKSLYCNKAILEAIFSLLPNLTSLTLTSYSSPFWEVCEDYKPNSSKERTRLYFEAIWDQMEDSCSTFDRSNFLDSRKSVDRYTSVLLATLKLPTPLETLDMDAFPIDCFAQDFDHLEAYDTALLPTDVELNQRMFDQMRKAVATVQNLEIGIIGSGDPATLYSGANLGKALGKFIGSMETLQSLSVDWMIEEDVSEEFMLGWDTTFFGLHFKKLKDLRFTNIESPRAVVSKFILKHKDSLKRLHWSFPDFDEGDTFAPGDENGPPTWRSIFTKFKEELTKLECCELVDDSDYSNLYLKNWEPESRSGHKRVPASKLLEMFVLGKIPWPMKKDNPHHYKGWQPKHSTTNDDFASQTMEQLAELYSEEWETDKEDTTDSDMDDDDDDDDSDDDSELGEDEEDSMELDGEDDEWEDEDEDSDAFWEAMDANYFANLPNLITGQNFGDIPPEVVLATMARFAEEEMDADVD